jgi:type IV pilus assembly protein PilF
MSLARSGEPIQGRVAILCIFLLSISVLSFGCAGSRMRKTPEERAQLFLEAAAASKSEGDLTSALQYLAEAEKLNDGLPEIYHLRAIVMNSKGESQLAVESARKALSLRNNYSDAMNTLGRLLMERAQRGTEGAPTTNQLSEAESWLSKAASDLLYRDAWKSKTNLGILHYRKGNDSQALQYFSKAVEDAPAQACIAHYYIGHLRLKTGSFLEAARSYDRATQKFCAGFADAHLAEGVALERAREYDKARKKFLEITRNFPNSPIADQAVNRLKNIP